MRNYLFRGKIKDEHETSKENQWVYGSLIVSENRYFIIPKEMPVCATIIDTPLFYLRSINRFYEVDPETVGQWTGLTDKNETKIFQGDIIYVGDIKVGVISYSNIEGLYHFSDSFGSYICSLEWIAKYRERYHVSKSIHDNPEMLK
jgi:uncharacterized phage protein (TIGR01671 family)